MILSDSEIKQVLKEKSLLIDPIEENQIQPASVDIRLGDSFCMLNDCKSGIINTREKPEYINITREKIILFPGQFILGTTMEYIKLPDSLTAFVEGRSSLGRLGIFVQNAGWVDPGFEGEITLELFNASRFSIELHSGDRIAQLVFAKMERSADKPYGGKYNGQRGATGSRVFMDFAKDS